MGCLHLRAVTHTLLIMHISLVVNNREHLFKGMFTMRVSSLDRCLSKYLETIQENGAWGSPVSGP